MRLTGRGWAVVALVGFCLLMAWEFGARSLNAVVVPLVVSLLAGVVSVARLTDLSVSRAPVEPGHVGDTRTVGLEFDVGSTTLATVSDAVGDGVAAHGNVAKTTLTDDGYRYEIDLLERGDHEIGPLTVTVTDALGLVTRRFSDDATVRVLVYPRVFDVRGGPGAELRALTDAAYGYERDEFDHLREYERGDPLRDVHWKSAAKRADDELLVKEFTPDDERGRVDLVAESAPGWTDELATATASVATHLLEAGVTVDVTVPDGSRSVTADRGARRELFALLATTGPGERPPRERRNADVSIRADGSGTVVRIDGQPIPFDRLRADDDPSVGDDPAVTARGERSGHRSTSDSGVVA